MPRRKMVKKESDGPTFENCMASILEECMTKRAYECLMKLSKFDPKILDMTRSEFINITSSTLSMQTLHTSTMQADITSVVKSKTTKRTAPRSSSCNTDKGYLTTGSSSSVDTDRSRSRVKKMRPNTTIKSNRNRLTRSISRMQTPLNNGPSPADYGMITPKVKPGTPLVMLRRPKMGELVLSTQGSPVLTGPVVAEGSANINIPLPNGTVLSLQAEGGLRKSHLPEIDGDIMKQLEMLRRNLDIVL